MIKIKKGIVLFILGSMLTVNSHASGLFHNDYNSDEPKVDFTLNDSIPITFNKKKSGNSSFVGRMLPDASYRRVGKPSTFIPKGQWLVGATITYAENSSDNMKFMILDNITTSGYNVKTTAYAGYAFANDAVAGIRAGYTRGLMDMESLSLSIDDDLNFDIKDYYSLNHSFIGMVFLRNYISLFNSMRFALFSDLQLSVESGQGKMMSGVDDSFTGTYSENTKLAIGITPGVSVFLSDYAAFEISVGVLGFESEWKKQITDQVTTGRSRKSSANFKVDLFTLKLGMTFYFNQKKISSKI